MLGLIDGELQGLLELTENINFLELSETNTGKALPDTQSGILEVVTMGEQETNAKNKIKDENDDGVRTEIQSGIKYEVKREDMLDSVIKDKIKDEIKNEHKV
ncbi:hypothetical protein N7451_001061 [Penicillium sp. IBT 35674x]|nr:hypothetical protein N7451_001061 [Penicillium sp. IBT 35674x]